MGSTKLFNPNFSSTFDTSLHWIGTIAKTEQEQQWNGEMIKRLKAKTTDKLVEKVIDKTKPITDSAVDKAYDKISADHPSRDGAKEVVDQIVGAAADTITGSGPIQTSRNIFSITRKTRSAIRAGKERDDSA